MHKLLEQISHFQKFFLYIPTVFFYTLKAKVFDQFLNEYNSITTVSNLAKCMCLNYNNKVHKNSNKLD